MYKLYLLFAASLLASCANRINFYGNSLAPTQKVDVYVEPRAVGKPYTVIGKGFFEPTSLSGTKAMQRKAIKKARHSGADAVLFIENIIFTRQSSAQQLGLMDSSAATIFLATQAGNENVVSPRISILFLKYK